MDQTTADTTSLFDQKDIDPDIRRLVCTRCWETVFSAKSFRTMWEATEEGARLDAAGDSRKELYDSVLTYRTPPWAAILESADASCNYCIMIRNARRAVLRDEPLPGEVLVVTARFDLASNVQRIELRFWQETGPVSSVNANHTSIYAEPEDPASQYITARNVVWNTNDSTTYELALRCVKNCSQHEHCPPLEPSTLPTRLLDCSDPSRLRLINTKSMGKGSFAALSYAWGDPQLHCTTMQNLNLYSNSIDSTKIPKTITDAIIVTRRLGLQYLWVDSFCIIQDSDEDKAKEISRMRLNFRNAFVTIAAARASTASEGFLTNPSLESHFEPLRLPFRCPDGAIGTVVVVREVAPSEPVDTRAWCLGERVLSPRILVFTSIGLQYECQAARVNINGSRLGLPWTVPRLPDFAFMAKPGQLAEWQLDMSWDSILQIYTASDLTNEEDKLLAIAGVAEQVHRLWPHTRYAAGIWTHQLPTALLWEQQHRRPPPIKYRAPSWSWAAVDGRISPRGMAGDAKSWKLSSERPKDNSAICEVKDVVINLKYPTNPYGEVTSAHMILYAELVRVTWNTHEDSQPHILLPDEKIGLVIARRRNMEDNVGFVTMDAVELPTPRIVEVTLAGVTKYTVPFPAITRLGQYDIHGLILLPVAGGQHGSIAYRRIGSFVVNAENWFPIGRQDIRIV